ncbi:MAG TPA: SRPBCC family protein [Polyangiaceae bacterium]|nr:SRPBCC family protein [Polyangiaceae bacterium]
METPTIGRREISERRARLLGYLSLGLGLSELAAPRQVARLVGARDKQATRAIVRALGVRGLVTGFSILGKTSSAAPVWSRVAGDAIDLALLGTAMSKGAANRGRLVAAIVAVAGVGALDAYSAARLSRSKAIQDVVGPIHVVRSITINRQPEVVYGYWRFLENLPSFMAHLESVRVEGDTSVWRANAPAGTTVEWRAEVTLDEPNRRIGWRSLEGSTVPNRGVVRFEPGPGGRGTVVCVELKYELPGGAISALLAKLFGEEPGQQISGDLRRLKQVLETGGVVHSDASIHRGVHPARPAAHEEQVTLLGGSEQ